jgi:nucleoside phosphorylase
VDGAVPAAESPYRHALLAALSLEVRPFLRLMAARRRRGWGLPAWDFPLGQGRGVLLLSGMGEQAARQAGSLVLRRCRPHTLVSVGFGGALFPGLEAGAVVLGRSFWRFDPESAILQGIPAPAPPRPLPDLLHRLRQGGTPAVAGSCVTTPYILTKAGLQECLRDLPHPVLDLETATLAALAQEQGLAFLSLRAVTDTAGEEIPQFLINKENPNKVPGPGTALAWLAADPRRLRILWRLWRRSRDAGQQLARALQLLLPQL